MNIPCYDKKAMQSFKYNLVIEDLPTKTFNAPIKKFHIRMMEV